MPVRAVVVDDSLLTRRMVARLAEASGGVLSVVGEAADGAEAVEVCSDAQPDLVLLDLEMPGINGIEALPLLRAAVPGARLVMFTSDPSREEEARAAGADDYIIKAQVDTDELIARLTA